RKSGAYKNPDLKTISDGELLGSNFSKPVVFEEIYRRYVKQVYRYLYSYVGNVSEAEDLTSQVFISAWESLQHYREQGNFAAWLFRIARNRANDYYRRNSRSQQIPIEKAATLCVEWNPIERIESEETFHHLRGLVQKLDAEKAELLRLRFAADLSYADIAVLLGRSEDAVKMLFHRLLHKLKEDWKVCNE
ncbi:MAG: RNA polymerase sigma factor, partial [Omnitrophica WOR_2 bacterium]